MGTGHESSEPECVHADPRHRATACVCGRGGGGEGKGERGERGRGRGGRYGIDCDIEQFK